MSVPPDVERFVAEHIEAPEELDILLLLLHREPGKEWTAAQVSQAVYTVPSSAAMRLERLVERGFAASSGGADPRYAYSPRSDELRRQVDALAEVYAKDRVGVIKLIFARPADPLRNFADAFRLKGKGS